MRLAICLLIICFIQVACNSSAQQLKIDLKQGKAERKPLTRVPVKIEIPKDHNMEIREDGTLYDHNPRVFTTDEQAGKYEFRWVGFDGKEKVIKYQRNGAIDITVSATFQKQKTGSPIYIYSIENMPSSRVRLSGFTVQTKATDVRPIEFDFDNSVISPMSDLISGFRDGKWLRFALLQSYKPQIDPGSKIDFKLYSDALPGLVECKASGGEFGSSGVGEDPPPEIDKLFVGTKDWPYGYTIGPVDSLGEMTKPERATYVLDNLPKFVEAGWMAGDTSKIYEAILKRNDLAGALEQARKDLEKEFITSEVFHIIDGLNR